MTKLKYTAIIIPVFFTLTARAQQDPSFQIYRTYHAASDLLNKGKYVAAAEQFRLVERSRLETSTQPKFESSLTLVQENSQYYEAVCSLELGNDDAESLFMKFIKEHPENPLAKVAYFQIGKFYFKQGKYTEALNWFNKVNAGDLIGSQTTEYKFRKGYAYFETNDYKNAQLLFSEVKNEQSP